MGNCKDAKPIYGQRGLRPCGMGIGRGIGRSFNRQQTFMQPQIITESQEKEMLKQELEAIKAEKTEIEAYLKKLK